MVNIKDVAKIAGVSIGTVSNVINGKRQVSKELRKRVREVIRQLGYVPKESARNLKGNRTRSIGVILPTISDPYYARIYTGLQNYLYSLGYAINLVVTSELLTIEEEALLRMVRERVDGIVMVSCNPEDMKPALDLVVDKSIPVVMIDRMTNHEAVNFVSIDYREIGARIGQELIKQGFKSVVLVTGTHSYTDVASFIEGIVGEYEKQGKRRENIEIFQTGFHKFYSFKLICNYLHKKNTEELPDIIVTMGKTFYEGVTEALEIMQVKKKKVIPVWSLEEQNWLKMIGTSYISVVFRPAFQLGKMAGKILHENMRSIKIHTPKRVIIPLNEREFEKESDFDPYVIPKNSTREITLFMLRDLSTKAIDVLGRDFAGQNFTLNIHEFDIDDLYKAIINSRNSSGVQPDIFMIDIPWLSYLVDHEYLYNITPLIKEDDSQIHDYIPGVFEAYSCYKGDYYALPFNFSQQILFYRSDLFEDAEFQRRFEDAYNVKLRPPETWDEYNAVAEFFTRRFNPDSPVEYGNTIGGGTSSSLEYFPRLWAFGGSAFNEKGEVILNSYHGVVSLENYVKSYLYAKPGSVHHWWWDQIDSFAKGDAAMMIMYVNHTGRLVDRDNSKVVGKFSVSTIPGGMPVLGGWSLAINSKTEKIKESYKFIRWASSARIGVPFTILGGCTPRSTLNQTEELQEMYPYLRHAEKDFKKSRKRTFPLENFSEYKLDEMSFDRLVSKYIKKAVRGQLDCEKAIAEASHEIERML